eukprot:11793412-Alexandrium_andersonii.AAC.1
MQFLNLHWEDGRASCAPLLDGLTWDGLGPTLTSESAGSEFSDAERARNRSSAKVRWADMADAHDGAQSL